MDLTIILDYIIISIIASMTINSILRNYAKKYNILVDIPDRSRKFHKRPTPMTGGLGILISLLISGKLYIDLNNLTGYIPEFTFQLMVISIPLLLLFLIDDLKELKPIFRFLIQSLLSIYMIMSTGVYLESLGDLFGFGFIYLGIFGIPFTVFCIVGIMNAFNMLDGINGLCSGCAMIALMLIGFYSGLIYDSMLVLIIGSMIGFILFNLGMFGKKREVFLGDSGSNLIGFWVAWIAIYASQSEIYNIQPVTMLWFVAIPLLDCIGLIFKRIRKGKSLSTAGRDHIHHKLMEKFSSKGTLSIILLITFGTGLIGIVTEINVDSHISTYLFFVYALAYYLLTNYLWNNFIRDN
jgi:UDP-GlcNAc:undecaprenyl-phosphate GlcNAc-1-phosphate transferase|tara:strand:+ start:24 stop:1079 length:1056 start_codon:yes stop_codon:yes gene_type:complete